ncbi:dermonecrotic toxin domain-containing protein [Pseudomonas triticicola]|uniref:dermonecrotic toxin domain-containing protein n=1 Tax=Pseudomonas triticicola TaxID=2842345 RepID=UPI003EB77DC3
MHLSDGHSAIRPSKTPDPQHPDEHYQPLKNAISPWLGNTSASRREALKTSAPKVPEALKSASAGQHAVMKKLTASNITAQSQVDKSLEHLQDAAAFAEPLLKAELKNCFNLDLDVRNTFVRLYIPVTTPWFAISTGARVWSVSLLDAALHNFEERETYENAFEAASTYTTAPSASGQFEPLPDVKARLSIAAFTQLCRRLDIGAQYKASLENNLGYSDPMVATVLRGKLDASEKAAMKAALQWARMNRDVSENHFRLVDDMLEGLTGIYVDGAPVLCHDVTMLCAPLTGIVVFAPDLYMTRNAARVVAYVPNDPEHPFKEYASPAEMLVELTRQLRSKEYQEFFSRFVNHEHRGYFFSTLNSRLSEIKWHPHEPGSALPAWREAPVERPDLQSALVPFYDDLWQHLHQAKLNKVFNDARVIAVPTAWVDQRARWAFWDSVVNILSSIAQTAALIVAPFVPVLGEAMMAYMAYQMLDETFEGIVEWAQGRNSEAIGHLMDTVDSMIQLGLFAVGGAIAAAEFRKALPAQVVAFIDRFKPVKLAKGETRYWQPDLERYKHPLRPPADSQPDALGLHAHQDKQLLPLEDAHFSLKPDEEPGQYRIEHPTRPDAYQPAVHHNGEGAWHTELEQPLERDGETVLRRIGPSVEGFSPAERDTILHVSGTSEDVLRKMHVNREKLPPLLADSIQRFKIDQQLQRFIDQMDSETPEDFLRADPVTQLQLLSEHGRWPRNERLRLLDRNGELLWQSSTDESLPLTELQQDRLIGGDLLKSLLSTLDEAQIKALLAEPFALTPPLDVRSQTLRKQLVGLAKTHRSTMFESRYQALQSIDDPLALPLQAQVPELPASVTRELLDTATGGELLQLDQGQVPPRQQELLQLARQEVRVTRAYEGLQLGSVSNPDSEALALHSLKLLPGWTGDVRIEIRDGRYDGPLRDGIGRQAAPEQKVLVRSDDGRYQAFDERGQALHSLSDFYSSLLYALPDSERQSLDLRIGQGQALKAALRARTLERSELRQVLSENPLTPPKIDTLRLVGVEGYPRRSPPIVVADTTQRTLEGDIRTLYPRMSDRRIEYLARNMRASASGPRAELLRLQNDYLQLQNELQVWANSPPTHHPETGSVLTSMERRAEIRNRRLLREQLLQGWRRENVVGIDAQGAASGHALLLTHGIMGDLPVLSADFSHITLLAIDGNTTTRSLDSFLQSFTRLQSLDARNLNLPSLPQTLTSMPALRELRMRNCRISLTTTTQSVLASLPQLTLLDLQGNSLGLPPDLHSLPSLRYVNLSNTGLYAVPDDILKHPRLISAQFDGNRITNIPDDFFNLASSLSDGYTFADNPLSAVSRERVKSFYDHTGKHFGVRPEAQDLQRTIKLFPSLDAEQATHVLYRLPGSRAEGRAQLSRWEAELSQLNLELRQWIDQASVPGPESGRPLSLEEHSREVNARRSFARQLKLFWRSRTALGRAEEFKAAAEFSGAMPVLNANFEHVSRLNLTGNSNLSAIAPFVQRFPNLTTLRLDSFGLDTATLAGISLPGLSELELKNCGVVLTPENQATLISLNNLRRLDLSDNPLGTFPDLNLLPELRYIDLSNSGLTVVPDGLASHPHLPIAVLTGNRITDLPDALFEIPAARSDGIYLSDNPLSATAREKIKSYYRIYQNDFDVRADAQDIALARQLFPELDQQEASDMIYDLPGNLADSRTQLAQWRSELEQMQRDLAKWAGDITATHPVTGQVLSAEELQAQASARTEFKEALEALWRQRSSETGARGEFFSAELKFLGKMPRLTADFGHIESLKLTGNAAISGLELFLERFPKLRALEVKAVALNEIPAFVSRLQALEELRLRHCAVTLTPAGQDVLTSLPSLKLVDLSDNPLTMAPDLRVMPALLDVFLMNNGLTALPEGIIDHPVLQTAYLNNNQITELPEAIFTANPQRADGIHLTDNPLSLNARERIKTYHAVHGRNFRVRPAAADITLARKLFPLLDDYAASNLIYRLPGTLQAGTAQLIRWEAEITRMISDLNTWREQVPVNNPSTGQLWIGEERAAELVARQEFGERLERLWRGRRTGNSALRLDRFETTAQFAGELPQLSADFSHITHLQIEGNSGLGVPDGFLRSFNGLSGLELKDFDLGRIPQALESIPSLETLMLSKCRITLDAAGQATLSTLGRLKALDLFGNPLQVTPDLSALTDLRFLDLIRTGIDAVPAGLEQLPQLSAALLNDNNIIELPGNLVPYTGSGMDVGANPLSAASRERIKATFQSTGDNFGVWGESADLNLIQSLYPSLTGLEANDLLYRLPGTLADGRVELMRRQTEITRLLTRLDTWSNETAHDPVFRTPLNGEASRRESASRKRFKENLETRLRRYPKSPQDKAFVCDLSFTGELPPLAGRFDYIEKLELTSTAASPPGVNRLVELFPKLSVVDIRNYPLREIPPTILGLDSLANLSLPDCRLTLPQQTAEAIAGMKNLVSLDLGDNPLGNVPDLSKLVNLQVLRLNNIGLSETPKGLFDLPGLKSVNLADNVISELPGQFPSSPGDVATHYNFSGNPLNPQSLQRLEVYNSARQMRLLEEQAGQVNLNPPLDDSDESDISVGVELNRNS